MAATKWQNQDVAYLEDSWAYKPIKLIAKKLGKTETAVIMKAKRLGIGSPYTTGEYISAHQAAKILGVDVHAVTDYWIPKCNLKAKKMALNNQQMWRISLTNLSLWLGDNQDKWDSRKVDFYALGTEPDWLKQKRTADMAAPVKFRKWTPDHDSILISLYKHGFTQMQIGERMGRTESGVQRRISRLKECGKLTKCKVICKWSTREEVEFIRLEAQGLSDTEIAMELGREREHIVDHRRNLRIKGLYQNLRRKL